MAREAGLQGIYCSGSSTTNILRSDNKEPLFKLTEVGKRVFSHGWVEVKTSSGQWIPLDPSTNLVGDTQEGLTMFKNANYMAEVQGFKTEVSTSGSISAVIEGSFAPAEATTLASLYIRTTSSVTVNQTMYRPYKGDVKVILSRDPEYSTINFRMKPTKSNLV